eukprot:TRINITY_DN7237_c1_g1_i4.p1 TRINITY_DN7237_c1_g1~~TRINITY_DN7237_c1_g1_i4.p1  ORF type:complete len:541 (-),score=150.91 TRINITY_DN7237_c1_g1_i4:1029-2603(-)
MHLLKVSKCKHCFHELSDHHDSGSAPPEPAPVVSPLPAIVVPAPAPAAPSTDNPFAKPSPAKPRPPPPAPGSGAAPAALAPAAPELAEPQHGTPSKRMSIRLDTFVPPAKPEPPAKPAKPTAAAPSTATPPAAPPKPAKRTPGKSQAAVAAAAAADTFFERKQREAQERDASLARARMHVVKHPLLGVVFDLLAAMSFDARKCEELTRIVDTQWAEPARSRVLDGASYDRLFDTLYALRSETSRQQAIIAAVRIQAWWRRYRAKLIFARVVALKQRNDKIRDLVRSERQFVQKLKSGLESFYIPLKQNCQGPSKSAVISLDDFTSVFANYERLFMVHSDVRVQVEKLLDRWPNIRGNVGSVFLRMAQSFQVYGHYTRNFMHAKETLMRLEQNEKFRTFVEDLQQRTENGTNLEIVLSFPLNRLSHYDALLADIISRTPTGHEDFQDLEAVHGLVKQTAEIVRTSLGASLEHSLVLEMQRKLIGAEESGIFAAESETHHSHTRTLTPQTPRTGAGARGRADADGE